MRVSAGRLLVDGGGVVPEAVAVVAGLEDVAAVRVNSGVMRGRRRVFGSSKTFGNNRSPRGTAWKRLPTFGSRFGHTLA